MGYDLTVADERKKPRTTPDRVRKFVSAVLIASGSDCEAAHAVADALTETSLRGVDSHGIRLLLHYAKVVQTGRINPKPKLLFTQTGPSTGVVDADNGFGHYASFYAIDRGVEMVQHSGIVAVSIVNSSHFGSAGCYVLRAAKKGHVALCVCNSDSFVLLHDGIQPFHGTNPLAFAAPAPGTRPFLVDMATSVIPWNRVQDLLNENLPLPSEVAVDIHGEPTLDPVRSAALLPLGGSRYGYKGAALAGMIEVLSAVVTGMPHCSRIPGMAGPDFTSHRRLGHFFIVIDPSRFISPKVYNTAMNAYLNDLRSQPGRAGSKILAPGDREWLIEKERNHLGIPIGRRLKIDLDSLADDLGIKRLEI